MNYFQKNLRFCSTFLSAEQVSNLKKISLSSLSTDSDFSFHKFKDSEVFKPLIAYNILQSIDILADSVKNFSMFCVKGIKANKKRIKEHLDNSLMLVTALAPKIGYDNAAKIAKKALKNGTKLKDEAIKSGLINEKDYDLLINPKRMIKPS